MTEMKTVRIFYIKHPKGMNSWLEPDANAYATITTQFSCDEDITGEKVSRLIKEYLALNPEGYINICSQYLTAEKANLNQLYFDNQQNGLRRSMMVGDVVQVEDKFFAVLGIGFQEFEGFEI